MGDVANDKTIQIGYHDAREELQIKELRPETGILGSSVLLCATTLGAGILAIPHTVNLLGIYVGIATIAFFGVCTGYSIYLLLVAGDMANVRSYESLMETAFPKVGKILTTIFINVLIFGGLTGFLVIIADSYDGVMNYFMEGNRPWYTDKNYGMLIIAAAIVFPLSLVRNISKLEYSSLAAVVIIGGFTFIVIIIGCKQIIWDRVNWPLVTNVEYSAASIFAATPIVSLAYTCQMSIFPIWNELRNPTVNRMNIVQMTATIFSGILYCIMGFFGYIMSAPKTPGNIILFLPSDQVFFLIIRIAFGFAIVFHYPVVHFAFRNSLEVTLFSNYKFSYVRHVLETLLVMAASAILAIFLKDLSKVFDLTGSIAAYPIDFIFPAICYAKVAFYDDNEEEETFFKRRYTGFWSKIKRLFVPEMIPVALMTLIALVSQIISLYVTIYYEFVNPDAK